MSYNGWSNHATWQVNLWLSNDDYNYRECESMADAVMEEADDLAQATDLLADRIQELVEDGNPLRDEYSLYSEIVRTALDEVDWQELAEGFLPDVWPEEDAPTCATCTIRSALACGQCSNRTVEEGEA